jgi:hypothetical protein
VFVRAIQASWGIPRLIHQAGVVPISVPPTGGFFGGGSHWQKETRVSSGGSAHLLDGGAFLVGTYSEVCFLVLFLSFSTCETSIDALCILPRLRKEHFFGGGPHWTHEVEENKGFFGGGAHWLNETRVSLGGDAHLLDEIPSVSASGEPPRTCCIEQRWCHNVF